MKTFLQSKMNCSKINFLFFLLNAFLFSVTTTAQPVLNFIKLAGGFSGPLEIKNAGDGSNRLFIAEQGGLIKIYKNGKILNKPFLDLRNLVGVNQFQGIWSIVFSPNYITNGFFYVLYTDKGGITALARYKVSKTNVDSAMASSATILLRYPKSGAGHYGDLQFGNDGYLYITLGAGGNNKFSQDGQSDFGKMLRIDVNVNIPPYYKIPSSNPFVNDPNVLDEIWALGLRNAWRYSFDKNNGDNWIADVGEDSVEEVDYRTPQQGLKGSNFGFECYEGSEVFKPQGCLVKSNYIFPIFEYPHDIAKGGECIIGGYVYRGAKYQQLKGYYICADYVSANAWEIKSNGYRGWNVYLQSTGIPKGIASFGEDENGELYAVSQRLGTFYKITATAPIASIINANDVAKAQEESFVYPTIVNTETVVLGLKETYKCVRVFDMMGHELIQKDISGITGKTFLHLPKLNTGFYCIELVGSKTLYQKIYVTR